MQRRVRGVARKREPYIDLVGFDIEGEVAIIEKPMDVASHIEFLARLVAEEATATRNRRMAARLRYARFPFHKTIDDFDFEFQPSIDRKLIEDLATLRFVDENRPILFLGQPGCGKTHLLAVALAIRAVEAGWRASACPFCALSNQKWRSNMDSGGP